MAGRVSHFQTRLEAHIDELRELYLGLYHDEQAFDYFLRMLKNAYHARKPSLRRRDLNGIEHPDRKHSQKMLGMMLYTENFAGDLNGVTTQLPYLIECGVNYLHLMPLLDSPEGKSDGGYAVSDFRKVRPDLGTMDDLEDLTAACHRRGIMVCLDFVMNHTSDEHAWAKAARAGDPVAQSRYFFYDDWTIPDQFQQTMPEVFPLTAPGNFTWFGDCGKIVMTTFYPFQWDLNYANPTVFNDMTDNLLYLANKGVDVIRLDAVPYIWKTLGTNCRNLPEVHTLTRMMNLACRIVCPSVMLLGEVVMEPKEVVPYFGTAERPECDILYNVTTMCTIWHTVATRDVRLLKHQIEQIEALPSECLFQNYLRCHDDIGWGLDYGFLGWFGIGEAPHKKYLNDWFTGKWPGSPSRGELYNDFEALRDARLCGTTASLCGIEAALFEGGSLESAVLTDVGTLANEQFESGMAVADSKLINGIGADLMLHALMMTLRGIPVLYSGDEVGLLNDYSYHDDPEKAADSRNIHRGKFDWNLAGERHVTGTVSCALFRGLAGLVHIRKTNEVFRSDAEMSVVETGDNRVLGIVRKYGYDSADSSEADENGHTLLALFNFSPEYCRATIETAEWRDLTNPDHTFVPGDEEQMEYWLEPYGYRWLIR